MTEPSCEQLKQLITSDTQRLHDKYATAITVQPGFRVTISVNDDPDKLRVLPLLTPDMKDKVHLFQVSTRPLSFETTTLEERAAFREKILAELGAYAFWLLNEFEVPHDMRSARFGVKAFIHPALASVLFEDTPEAKLLALIDYATWEQDRKLWELELSGKSKRRIEGSWEGSAEDLEEKLRSSSIQKQAERLLCNKQIGRLLGRLAHDQPDRIVFHRTNAGRRWIIMQPPE